MDGASWRPPASIEPDMMVANDDEALRRRLDAGTLTWRGPALMLFARAVCAVAAQALVAAIFALRSSPTHGMTLNLGCRCTGL